MSYKDTLKILSRRLGATGQSHAGPVPQSKPLPGQVPNAAGGYVFPLGDWQRLDRFLVLGSDKGTYYVAAQTLTLENAAVVLRCLEEDGLRVVRRIVEISQSGRAPRNDPALLALALATAAEREEVRRAALAAVPQVARIGTHILAFAGFVQQVRGWGRGLRRAVSGWFTGMSRDRLALQAVKYRQREGWALRDLLRLAHPLTDDLQRRALIDWIAHPDQPAAIEAARAVSPLIDGLYAVRSAKSASQVADLIVRYSLPREAVPTEWLDRVEIWDALLVDMPMTAMIRNLGKMSAVGLITPGSAAAWYVAEQLGTLEALRAARVHPIQLLLALATYRQGRGFRGKLSWQPAPELLDALNEAFHAAFALVQPSGKRLLVAVDVSGSMTWSGGFGGSDASPLSAMEMAAAVAMQFLRTEQSVEVIGVDTSVHYPGVSARQRLDDAVSTFRAFGGGGTNLALPMQHALKKQRALDGFVILTDCETWAGREHPQQVLERYRERVNPAARLAVLATTATHGSVVPETDPLSLGVAGFDAAAPQLVTDFMAQPLPGEAEAEADTVAAQAGGAA